MQTPPDVVDRHSAAKALREESAVQTMSRSGVRPIGNQRRGSGEEIVFSLQEGFVWASWPGAQALVRLGRHEHVIEMMQDFLAHDALVTRLTKGQ